MYEGKELCAKEMEKKLWEFKLSKDSIEPEVVFEQKPKKASYLREVAVCVLGH